MQIDRDLAISLDNKGHDITTGDVDDTQRQLDALNQKFKEKPFIERYARHRKSSNKLTIFIQFLGACLAFYGAKVIFEYVPVPIPFLDYALAAIFLYFLEKGKRRFSDDFWDSLMAKRRGWCNVIDYKAGVINLFLFSLSAFLSLGGGWFAVTDAGENTLQIKLEELNQEYIAWSTAPSNTTRSDGKRVVKYDLWGIQKQKLKEIENLRTEIENTGVSTNETSISAYKERTLYSKYSMVGVTCMLEIVFEIIMCFCSYYDAKLREYLLAVKASQKGSRGKKAKALSIAS